MESTETKTPPSVVQVKNSFFEKMSFCVYSCLVFLLPLFFIPNTSIEFSKNVLFVSLTLVSLILWIIAVIKRGEFRYPKSIFFLALILLPLTALTSALFSGSISSSLWGDGFETGTFVSLLMGVLLLFLSFQLLVTKKRIFKFYFLFLASFFLVVLFQVARLIFGADFLSLGVFQNSATNLIGKWNELGIFFGLSAVTSLVAIQCRFPKNRFLRLIEVKVLVLSLAFLAIVNFLSLWIAVGAFALLLALYWWWFGAKKPSPEAESQANATTPSKRMFAISSLVVLVISLIFIFWGGNISAGIKKYVDISDFEVRPNWVSTWEIGKNTLASKPYFGAGPNQFQGEWQKYKPDNLNLSPYWNADFNIGIGLIPTYFITTGIVGGLTWIFFLFSFLWLGWKALRNTPKDPFSRFAILFSFFGALFLWVFHVAYIPGTVLYVFAFLFTGVFIATLQESKHIGTKTTVYTLSRFKKISALFLLGIGMIGTVALGYIGGQRFLSIFFVQKGITEFNKSSNSELAEADILSALNIFKSDDYYRILTQLYAYDINVILNTKDVSTEILKSRFETVLPKAIESAKAGVALGKTDYQNFAVLGSVYESVFALGNKDAYGLAKEAYGQATKLNPRNPSLVLFEARLEALNNNMKGARDLIAQSLKLKNNYIEAIYLLSQIEILENNLPGALSAVEAASKLDPGNPVVFFQLGFLKYSGKDYAGARDALLQSVSLANGTYSNARYFLGLSYYKLGQKNDALAQFEEIQKLNLDNKEVELILSNLRAGREPFTDAKPPIDNEPENRKELPVQEGE
ncbi:MAG: hypothetical protein ABI430_03855 [Candidatus Taylorbacteria bacterium]